MNGRNRSRRQSRQNGAVQSAPRFRQHNGSVGRQRRYARHRESWYPLPVQIMHRYNVATLSVGGCF